MWGLLSLLLLPLLMCLVVAVAVAVAVVVAVAVSACFESDKEAPLHGTVRGVHGGFS